MDRYRISVGDEDFEWGFPAHISFVLGSYASLDVMIDFDPAIEDTLRARVLAQELAARLLFEVALSSRDDDVLKALNALVWTHSSELLDLEDEDDSSEEEDAAGQPDESGFAN